MWLIVTAIDGDQITGKLGNSPIELRNIREGDCVQVLKPEIGDWVYTEETVLVGGFSLPGLDS